MSSEIDEFSQTLIDQYFEGPPNQEFAESLIATLLEQAAERANESSLSERKIDLIFQFLERGVPLTPKIRVLFEKSCHLRLYQYLDQLQLLPKENLRRHNIIFGSPETCLFLGINEFDSYEIYLAADHGRLDLLKIYFKSFGPAGCDIEILEKIIVNGHLPILEWLMTVENLRQTTISLIKYHAHLIVKQEHFHILDWIFKRSEFRGIEISGYAIFHDRISVLEWLKLNNQQIIGKSSTINTAISKGYLHILEWLKSNHFDFELFPEYVLKAIKSGYLNIVKWLLANGISLKDEGNKMCATAIKNHNLEILEWLIQNGYKLDKGSLPKPTNERYFEMAELIYSVE